MGEKLTPCPFCGGTDTSISDTGVFWVACNSCDAEGPYRDSEYDAVADWNTRAPAQGAQVLAASVDVANWPRLIQKELQGVGELPCRVDEMTPREHLIFKMLASHNGFLQFMEAALRAPEAADAGAVAWQWRVRFQDGWMAWINGDIELATYRKEHARGIACGKIEVRELYTSPATDSGMRELDNERLAHALNVARNHLITLGGDGRPDPNADQVQAAILDLIDAELPSMDRCICGGSPDQPADHHDISCPMALPSTDGKGGA